jgi:hypothetical protein
MACLKVMFEATFFLLAQGLPFQGHTFDEGNYVKLLETQCKNLPFLKGWLSRRDKWMSHKIQNEMIDLVATTVTLEVTKNIRNSSFFATIADGTQDIEGKEQLSIVFRWVGDDFCVHDDFVGFYSLPDAKGTTIACALEGTSIRLQLPLSSNRALGFDGASNMCGGTRGARAILQKKYPRSLYFHCSNHCLDLCLQEICREETLMPWSTFAV